MGFFDFELRFTATTHERVCLMVRLGITRPQGWSLLRVLAQPPPAKDVGFCLLSAVAATPKGCLILRVTTQTRVRLFELIFQTNVLFNFHSGD